jgi:hypothetical protein
MSESCNCSDPIRRCAACDTLFEPGVADDFEGQPRCPQCGLAESALAEAWDEKEIVIRRSTPFR